MGHLSPVVLRHQAEVRKKIGHRLTARPRTSLLTSNLSKSGHLVTTLTRPSGSGVRATRRGPVKLMHHSKTQTTCIIKWTKSPMDGARGPVLRSCTREKTGMTQMPHRGSEPSTRCTHATPMRLSLRNWQAQTLMAIMTIRHIKTSRSSLRVQERGSSLTSCPETGLGRNRSVQMCIY
jgi:hypothetical protein